MSPFVRRASVRHTDRVLARSVLLLALAVYTATYGGLPEQREGEVAFQTTRSLARGEGFRLGATPEATWLAETAGTGPDEPLVPGVDGAPVGRFAPAYPFLAIPFYYAGLLLHVAWPDIEAGHLLVSQRELPRSEYLAHLAVGWRNALAGAATAWLIVLASRRVGVGRRLAWLAGVGYALTTFAWAQVRASTPDVQAAFFLMLAFHWVLQLRERFDRFELPRRRELFGTGAALGLAVSTRIATAPACAVVALALAAVVVRGSARLRASVWQARSVPAAWRTLALAALPFGVCVALYLLANHARFGDPLDAGGVVTAAGFGMPSPRRLLALLVSPGRGIVWFAPAVLLAPLGLVDAERRGECLAARTILAVAVVTLVTWSASPLWHGGWTFGPRVLLPALPFLWIAVARALGAAAERGALRRAGAVLLALGLLVQLPSVLVDASTHHDLAVRAADVLWSEPLEGWEARNARLERMQWHWGFAAPWGHWRILRHRVAGLGEDFEVGEIFRVDRSATLTPGPERPRGFRHFFWVDQVQRLGIAPWGALLFVLALFAWGAALAQRGLDPTAPD